MPEVGALVLRQTSIEARPLYLNSHRCMEIDEHGPVRLLDGRTWQ
jgi:hypothetical protein